MNFYTGKKVKIKNRLNKNKITMVKRCASHKNKSQSKKGDSPVFGTCVRSTNINTE